MLAGTWQIMLTWICLTERLQGYKMNMHEFTGSAYQSLTYALFYIANLTSLTPSVIFLSSMDQETQRIRADSKHHISNEVDIRHE